MPMYRYPSLPNASIPPLWLAYGWSILMIVRPEPVATTFGLVADALYSRTTVSPELFV